MFDVVTSPSTAFVSFAAVVSTTVVVDASDASAIVESAAVASGSAANSVAGDASDDDTPFVDDSIVLTESVFDDSSLLLSPVRKPIVAVTALWVAVPSGVTVSALDVTGASAAVTVATAVVVVDDAESLSVSPSPLVGVVVRKESSVPVLPAVVLANGVVNVLPSI